MKKIFARAWQKFVKSVALYADDNSVLCYDKEYSNPVSAKELKELFDAGLILISSSDDPIGHFRPIGIFGGTFMEDKEYMILTAVSSASHHELTDFYSAEYTADGSDEDEDPQQQ